VKQNRVEILWVNFEILKQDSIFFASSQQLLKKTPAARKRLGLKFWFILYMI